MFEISFLSKVYNQYVNTKCNFFALRGTLTFLVQFLCRKPKAMSHASAVGHHLCGWAKTLHQGMAHRAASTREETHGPLTIKVSTVGCTVHQYLYVTQVFYTVNIFFALKCGMYLNHCMPLSTYLRTHRFCGNIRILQLSNLRYVGDLFSKYLSRFFMIFLFHFFSS